MIECICQHCNKTFYVKPAHIAAGKGKYCSVECYNAVRVQKVNCTCEYCGKHFQVKQYTFDKNGSKYCSSKCSGLARRGEKVERVCLRCGKSFVINPSLVKENGNYCSKSCFRQSTKVERICEYCHKSFSVYPSQLKYDASIYCSKQCTGLAQSGKNNPHWKGGYGDYRGRSWNHQRKLARKRDGGVCQYCHRKPNKGEAKFPIHHIIPARLFGDNHVAANDLSNLITLCRTCHPKAEHGKIAIQRPLL